MSTTWDAIRSRFTGSSAGPGDGLRNVTWRLAAQTVGLLLVMLLVLEIVVYLITRQGLLGSLEDTLKNRAKQPDPTVCAALRLPCGNQSNFFRPGGDPNRRQGGPAGGSRRNPGSGPGTGRTFPPPGTSGFNGANVDASPSDASSVYVDAHLNKLDVHGNVTKILDLSGLRQTISTGTEQCCSVRTYQGQDFLTFSAPYKIDGRVVGAVQTSISEHQYESTVQNLQRSLLLVALLGLLAAAGISAILVRRALQPIHLAVQRQRDFVADAAHELRTPLAIMRTVGEVGMSSPSADELQATVAQMLSENQHLTRLVEDLSLLARTDTNAVSIERHSVDLSTLVSDTSDELRYLAEEQGVRLEAQVQPDVEVVGDTLRLRQLLLILLDNALKHTPATGVVRVDLATRSGRTRLQVTDSGPGINPADVSRIFDRFYRSDESRTGEGSGLGLAIAKWIVEAHGGHIGAGNASPHGAVFTVTLPTGRSATAPVQASQPAV